MRNGVFNTYPRAQARLVCQAAFLLVFFLWPDHSYAGQDAAITRQDAANPERRKISVAAQISYSNERQLATQLLNNFELSHPDVDIEIQFFRGDFTAQINTWLEEGSGPEVIYWYAGQHIRRLARKEKLRDLSEVWGQFELRSQLSEQSRKSVLYEGREYGLPISYYPWAMYYRKSAFDRVGLDIPLTWESWLSSCRKLTEKNETLFALSTKGDWPILIWFDYLTLRLWGEEFYHDLLGGKGDWAGSEVKLVLEHLKALIDNGCFNQESHRQLDLRSALPLLYHNSALMVLSGGYVMGNLPKGMKDQFDVAPFPVLRDDIPSYTVAPIDAFVVPHYSKLDNELKTFLLYLSESHFQLALNRPSARIAANISAQKTLTHHLQTRSIKIIEQAKTTQFFDRESHPDLALSISSILVEFIDNPEIDRTLVKLKAESNVFYQNQSMD